MADDLKIKISVTSDASGAQQAKREIEDVARSATRGAKEAEQATNKWDGAKKGITNSIRGLGLAIRGLPGAEMLSALFSPIGLAAAGIGALIFKIRAMTQEINQLTSGDKLQPIGLKLLGDPASLKQSLQDFGASFKSELSAIAHEFELANAQAKELESHLARMAELTGKPAPQPMPTDLAGINAEMTRTKGFQRAVAGQIGVADRDVIPMMEELTRARSQAVLAEQARVGADIALTQGPQVGQADVEAEAIRLAALPGETKKWNSFDIIYRARKRLIGEERSRLEQNAETARSRSIAARAAVSSTETEIRSFMGVDAGEPTPTPEVAKAWLVQRDRERGSSAFAAGERLSALDERRQSVITGARFAATERVAGDAATAANALQQLVSADGSKNVVGLLLEFLRRQQELAASVANLRQQEAASRNLE